MHVGESLRDSLPVSERPAYTECDDYFAPYGSRRSEYVSGTALAAGMCCKYRS